MSILKTFRFTPEAYADYLKMKEQEPKLAERVKQLITDILAHPFSGLGKPEPLKYHLSGYWSRRINSVHRLVYRVEGEQLQIISCKYHYK